MCARAREKHWLCGLGLVGTTHAAFSSAALQEEPASHVLQMRCKCTANCAKPLNVHHMHPAWPPASLTFPCHARSCWFALSQCAHRCVHALYFDTHDIRSTPLHLLLDLRAKRHARVGRDDMAGPYHHIVADHSPCGHRCPWADDCRIAYESIAQDRAILREQCIVFLLSPCLSTAAPQRM